MKPTKPIDRIEEINLLLILYHVILIVCSSISRSIRVISFSFTVFFVHIDINSSLSNRSIRFQVISDDHNFIFFYLNYITAASASYSLTKMLKVFSYIHSFKLFNVCSVQGIPKVLMTNNNKSSLNDQIIQIHENIMY